MIHSNLENYFAKFRKNIIGIDTEFTTPEGRKKLTYADWTASGRLYAPIEELISHGLGPLVGNTHTETTITGSAMTQAYHRALHIIKDHVGADENDAVFSTGSGMTRVLLKLQRILGLRVHENYQEMIHLKEEDTPVVFVTHMEHHSNHTTWLETIADVEVINQNADGLPDLDHFAELLKKYAGRKKKIAAVSAGSNVTGIISPYYEISEMVHKAGGLCFVDFACSAPYIPINMHPDNELRKLDAVYFSPHKFLGGPGSTGILVFDKSLYQIKKPDQPGGGTVTWTNPWGGRHYYKEIELREDGGTPAFLQTVKSALCIRLKEEMNPEKMLAREEELLDILWPGLTGIPGLHMLADNIRDRLGVLSFYFDDIHYNLVVKLLNDYFGIQVRSGCVCAGTYGHMLLGISKEESDRITRMIDEGDLSEKPGWVRLSIHPTMTDEEARFLVEALREIAEKHREWAENYAYDKATNEFIRKNYPDDVKPIVDEWFSRPLH